MRLGVQGNLQRFLQQAFGQDTAMPAELTRAIIRLQAVQKWFDHHRGLTMAKKECRACAKERIFTIWSDGNYHCLYCLYRQAWRAEDGPIPLETPAATVREFTQMWISYRRCCQSIETSIEDGWVLEAEKSPVPKQPSAQKKFAPLCDVEACTTCTTWRPHVLGAGGFKHCFYCLMKQGLKTVPVEVQKRPTMDRLDAVAAAAVASLQLQTAAI